MLHTATLTPLGRIPTASNATLVCRLDSDDRTTATPRSLASSTQLLAVYKPVRGEAPLMDFPDGTLAAREYASYLIDRALGWELIPETCLRDGPLGRGMVQRWVGGDPTATPDDSTSPEPAAADPDDEPTEPDSHVDLVPADEVPLGWHRVLDAEDAGGQALSLAHSDDPALRKMAVLDLVLNNADRKGGHILTAPDGRLYGVDHGICLHHHPKLRTVLWGWAGQPIPTELRTDISELRERLDGGTLLAELLTDTEISALWRRCEHLVENPVMPQCTPRGRYGYPPIPWPPW